MASGSGSVVAGRDPAWKYCSPIEGNRYGTKCNYCGHIIKSGGITRFKFHLSHTDPNSNTKKCQNVPPEVKKEMKKILEDKSKAKAKKAADIEEIRAELRDTMGGTHTHLMDEDDDGDDDDEDDDDVYMYPTDMHLDERQAYKAAVRASKASEWQRQQEEHFIRGKRKTGESSHPFDPRHIRRSQSVRHPDPPSQPIAPSLYKSSAAHAREYGVNVERVLSEEVHSDSFSKDSDDSFREPHIPNREVDSPSANQSSRPSTAATSASGYDGSRGGTDTGDDNTGGDIGEHQQSQHPMSQFTCEYDFTHCTQDEDHGSRRAGPGIGAIGKPYQPYRGREQTIAPYNEELLSGSFESMSIETQLSDSSNETNVYPPYVMSYGQPSSSTNEEYNMPSYPPATQMSYHVPSYMEGGFDTNTLVNLEYPIYVETVGRTQEIYAWHVRVFNQYYRGKISWYQYCLQQQAGVTSSTNSIEPHRSSFWY